MGISVSAVTLQGPTLQMLPELNQKPSSAQRASERAYLSPKMALLALWDIGLISKKWMPNSVFSLMDA